MGGKRINWSDPGAHQCLGVLLFSFFFFPASTALMPSIEGQGLGDADVRMIWACRLGTVNHFLTAGLHMPPPGIGGRCDRGVSGILEGAIPASWAC